MSAAPPLRDVALPPSPSWWPPAPGWLMLIGAVLLVLGIVVFIGERRRRRRQRWLQQFDQELQAAPTAAAELAAVAGLLRRAARLAQPGSEALYDQAWWQRVDPKDDLAEPQRRLLAEGAYRPQVAADEVAEVRRWARERYLQLLQERRR
ncbi:DUF4381 family protein [Stenotrophomonas cyclobalanopsidis]|uniref:DUF4381 family protein n=1 Tax=Stenotrophomonas cyclobalanopsidis TaxID=2771362 RepID=A0ABQ6T1D8_9GAMM|nr:DUF4381 family protein [Stenotrophomonas cyclobalanopsidis]KAA8999173.1 DUF4381 family protein [Stenotrophomonas cyclobalanopsidis]